MRVLVPVLLTVAMAAAASQLGPVGVASATGPGIRYLAPLASGSGDGTSWANAADLPRLNQMVVAAGPGGQVLLRADAGPYTAAPISLRQGGAAGAPVTIRGASLDGSPLAAVIVGNRTSPYASTGRTGGEVFRLLAGTSHVAFSDLRFENLATGFRFAADVSDVAVQHVSASNVRRFIEDQASPGTATATVDQLVLTDIAVAGYSKGVVRLQYDTRNVLIQDVTGDSEQQDGDNFAIGVQLDGTAHDVTLRRVQMNNSLDTLHSYWNGDGFTAESGAHDLVYDQTSASGNSDAGYDIKANRVTMTSIVSSDNKKNVRLWGVDVALTGCALTDPHLRGGTGDQTQLWLGDKARVTATGCTITDSSPATVVFGVGTASNLTVYGGSITYSAAASLRRGPWMATVNQVDTVVTVLPVTPAPGTSRIGSAHRTR